MIWVSFSAVLYNNIFILREEGLCKEVKNQLLWLLPLSPFDHPSTYEA